MLRRQSEKQEFWRWVLVEFVRSGLSVRRFCHREGISEPSFYSWRKKIAQLDAGGQPNIPNLIPVRVVPSPVGHVVSAPVSASVSYKTPEVGEARADAQRARSNAHPALAAEHVPATGLMQSPLIEVATPSGLVVRIDQACELDLIERTLLAIQNVSHALSHASSHASSHTPSHAPSHTPSREATSC